LATELGHLAVKIVQVFVMTPKITALCEGLIADVAAVRPRGCVFAEVVAQVAALAKDGRAALVLAAEVQLQALGSFVAHLDNFVPFGRDSLEIFYEW